MYEVTSITWKQIFTQTESYIPFTQKQHFLQFEDTAFQVERSSQDKVKSCS